MAIQTVGNRSFEGGKEIEPGAHSHREAVAAAAKRAAPSSSVAVDATVMAAISLDFGDAQRFLHSSGEVALLKQTEEELQYRETTVEPGDYFGVWETTRDVVLVEAAAFDDEWEPVSPVDEPRLPLIENAAPPFAEGSEVLAMGDDGMVRVATQSIPEEGT